jgi:8-oxo-dGTP diphosphatase
VSAVEVRAAGGVVIRGSASGPELLLIHRPKYGDWSFPKGKLDPGETFEGAALREVLEETGLACEMGAELPSVFYRDHRGREKQVRYWLMKVLAGDVLERDPDEEVDICRWLQAEAARDLLSYPHDQVLANDAICIYLGRDT